jgi:hypothetical protein
MPDLQRQINDRVAAFVADVTEIARQAAIETLSQALHNGGGGGVSSFAKPSAAPRLRGGKRTPQELDQTAATLYAHIEAHPGQRMEEIARALASTTRDLALPVKKLLAERRIRTEGQKRATKYFPGGGARVTRRPGRPSGKRRGRKAK